MSQPKKPVVIVKKEDNDQSTKQPSTGDKRQAYAEIKMEQVDKQNALVTDKAFVVVGNVDAGKSSLISTLVYNILDDGRGSGRELVARHRHEITSGKTSDISTRVLRFPNGKTATLIDLAGHQKYFTTTASGISGMRPDYAIVVVSPTRGVLDMTKQHFKMLMSYNIPVFIVVTRIDMALAESCKIVDREIRDMCKPYKRTVEFMNGYDKYHSYVRGVKMIQDNNLDSPEKITNHADNLIDATTGGTQQRPDIEEYINFETFKIKINVLYYKFILFNFNFFEFIHWIVN